MDNLFRLLTKDASVCILAIDSTKMVNDAQKIHNTFPVCTAALGRTLTAASMMGAMLKVDDGSVTVQFRGDGPAGAVVAVGSSQGNVKGYIVNPDIDLPLNKNGKLDVAGAIGKNGFLNVIKDLRMKEPYSGQVPIISGEIAQDITNYYATSEQIPTACALGVLIDRDYSVKAAGGFIIQALPFASDEILKKIENGVSQISSVSALISAGVSIVDIVKTVLGDVEFDIVGSCCVGYVCDCSRDRVVRAIISMGKNDLCEVFKKEKTIDVNCHFCNENYKITKEEIEKFI